MDALDNSSGMGLGADPEVRFQQGYLWLERQISYSCWLYNVPVQHRDDYIIHGFGDHIANLPKLTLFTLSAKIKEKFPRELRDLIYENLYEPYAWYKLPVPRPDQNPTLPRLLHEVPGLNCYGNPEYTGNLAAEIKEHFIKTALVCELTDHRTLPAVLQSYEPRTDLPLASLPHRLVLHVLPDDHPGNADHLRGTPAEGGNDHIAAVLKPLLALPRIGRCRVDFVIATWGLERVKLQLQAAIPVAFTLKAHDFDVRIRSGLETQNLSSQEETHSLNPLFVHDFTGLVEVPEDAAAVVLEEWCSSKEQCSSLHDVSEVCFDLESFFFTQVSEVWAGLLQERGQGALVCRHT
ncbi:hypothetical protein K458DRAFT_389784 [Lentithecium fluviatile CBS 122367]|uniref:Uncharacterized protein n=1 Tax=Lentithecium fluviatile CBS 122367 TaxID=1168545 RepID=A0A6G1J0Y8_9PLEO|nr:hypothetical protein K458DRAFT_389784 [Lentithecium fluviatile CBS 122367]